MFYTGFWVLIGMSLAVPKVLQAPGPQSLAIAALIGIAGLIGLYWVDVAMRQTPPATIAVTFPLQPVFEGMLQPLLWKRTIVGMMLICTAAFVQMAGVQLLRGRRVTA